VAIATDSNLLERPLTVGNFRLAPVERVEVVVDFRNAPDEIFLVNRLQQTDGRKPDGLVSPGTRLLKFVVSPTTVNDPSRVDAPRLSRRPGALTMRPGAT
jgi:FtsP/CotA-like multicopper oxidase with cupredoxin domain